MDYYIVLCKKKELVSVPVGGFGWQEAVIELVMQGFLIEEAPIKAVSTQSSLDQYHSLKGLKSSFLFSN
ncbi:hypothetical protein AB4355_13870 [Vibrio sp. 10N.261.49.A12]|uniref:hypothetical protein n=1 Tax=Vibrio sp. 10N.261.49.A12 TaxID=3229667 RepID=UPI00354DD622